MNKRVPPYVFLHETSPYQLSDDEKHAHVQREINKGLAGLDKARPLNQALIDEIKKLARKNHAKSL